MTDAISYPTDDMSSISKSLTAFIDEQWQQHLALFMNDGDSFMALSQALAGMIPSAGGKENDLANALKNYHQQYQQCYQALRELAGNIDGGAQAMKNNDQQIGNSFS